MNVTVIGIGKLGLGLALLLEKAGNNVLGVDINENYINEINNKLLKTKEPLYEELLTKSNNFIATSDLMKGIDFSDIIIL